MAEVVLKNTIKIKIFAERVMKRIFNTWSMFSKTCQIPVCEKSFEKTPLSSLLSGCDQ
jgi:hypothetical protein